MKIYSAKTNQTIKWINIKVSHAGQQFEVSVKTIDGKVEGDGIKGFYTSYLKYFNEFSDKVRQSHFKQIKEYVEKYIK